MIESLICTATLAVEYSSEAQDRQVVCPIMGSAIDPNMPTVQYQGAEFGFCCAGCDVTFMENPRSAIQRASLADRTVGVFLFDPISLDRIVADESTPYMDYRGLRYYFASEANKEEFASDPLPHSQYPEKEALHCPVMDAPIASYKAASGYRDHEGVRYFFCCAGCDDAFDAEPEKYASAAAEHVRDSRVFEQSAAPAASGSAGLTLAPTCAGCAGDARLLGADGLPTDWTVSYRFVATPDESAQHRFVVDYRVTPNLSIGIERAGGASGVGSYPAFGNDPYGYMRDSNANAPIMPRLTWFVTPETASTPSLTVGFTSDRLSTPRGQAYFATISKSIPDSPIAVFVSTKYSNFDGRVAFPFGFNWTIDQNWTLQTINDGDYTHMLLTRIHDGAAYSLVGARMKWLGFMVTVGF